MKGSGPARRGGDHGKGKNGSLGVAEGGGKTTAHPNVVFGLG